MSTKCYGLSTIDEDVLKRIKATLGINNWNQTEFIIVVYNDDRTEVLHWFAHGKTDRKANFCQGWGKEWPEGSEVKKLVYGNDNRLYCYAEDRLLTAWKFIVSLQQIFPWDCFKWIDGDEEGYDIIEVEKEEEQAEQLEILAWNEDEKEEDLQEIIDQLYPLSLYQGRDSAA